VRTPSDPDGRGLPAGKEQPGSALLEDLLNTAASEVGSAVRPPIDASTWSPGGVTVRASRPNVGREVHRNVPPRARHMSFIDFLTYVVSSRHLSLNFVMILFASAVFMAALVLGISAVFSHVHTGFTADFTSAGVTVGLTSAGAVAVVATAGSWVANRRRRAQLKPESGSADDQPKARNRS